jgi:hypothetical protein
MKTLLFTALLFSISVAAMPQKTKTYCYNLNPKNRQRLIEILEKMNKDPNLWHPGDSKDWAPVINPEEIEQLKRLP